ncbi:hypothetical protein [Bacillus sp. JCM 19034]|uniref:hypothetical protein n=1 Tax=Bacillus sp. JCM 19034 TaxID=1481928 RepID=UPI000785C64F|nr:hypothetical protein [Bacillus sp. JCM 19034]
MTKINLLVLGFILVLGLVISGCETRGAVSYPNNIEVSKEATVEEKEELTEDIEEGITISKEAQERRDALDHTQVKDWEEKRDKLVQQAIENDSPDWIIEETKQLNEEYFQRLAMSESNQVVTYNLKHFIDYYAREWNEHHDSEIPAEELTVGMRLYLAIEMKNNLSLSFIEEEHDFVSEMEILEEKVNRLADLQYDSGEEFKELSDSIQFIVNDIQRNM